MIVLLMGLPGAGKALVARNLEAFMGFKVLATGDIIRREIYNETELGLKMKDVVKRGDYVDDNTVISLVKSYLKNYKNLIIEGFPRNKKQAEAFDEMLDESKFKIDLVLHFDFTEEEMYNRLENRRVCPSCQKAYHTKNFPSKDGKNCDECKVELEKRADDDRKILEIKLKQYRKFIKPLINHYDDLGLVKVIDGKLKGDEMYAEVLASHKKFINRIP